MSKITGNDIYRMTYNAQAAFWASVAKDAKKFGITTGDLDASATHKFDDASYKVILDWTNANKLNESTQVDTTTDPIKSFEDYLGGK